MQFSMIETVIYLVGNLFRIYIIGMMFNVFFKAEGSRWRCGIRIAGYILFYIINSAAFLYFSWTPQLILLSNIIGTTIISITYLGTWKYRICAVILSLTLNTICEDLIYYLIVLLKIENVFVIGIIAADILYFMIILLLQKAVDLKNKMDVPTAEWVVTVIIPILSLIISTMVLDECRDEIAVAIGQICLVLANVLIFLLIDKIQSVYRERLDINLLKQQNQVYENQILLLTESEQRISALQHDLKNHLFSLEQLAEQSNSDSLKKYLQSLIKDVGGMHSFSETGNLVIDGFINSKLSKAKILGADIHIEISIPTNIEIEDKDISIILGNLLDNAVSAVGKCKEDKKISVIMRATPGKLYLKIENSHAEQIRKNGNKIISSKGDSEHHGIGLRSVQKVVEKYDGNMKVTYSENMFSVKVIMFIP